MLSFKEAEALFKRARDPHKGYRLPGRQGKTRLVRCSPTSYGIKFHYTVVVEIHKDGTYTVQNGGWTTPSTNERIRAYSPCNYAHGCSLFTLCQRGIVSTRVGTFRFEAGDRLQLDSRGVVVSAPPLIDVAKIKREQARQRYLYQKEAKLRRNPLLRYKLGRVLSAGMRP